MNDLKTRVGTTKKESSSMTYIMSVLWWFKQDGSCTRILNKSWKQHPTRKQFYDLLPPITQTIWVRWTRHAGHCWRSKDKLISDVLLWKAAHGHVSVGRPANTYIDQLCIDTGCCVEDLPRTMSDRDGWREIVMDICAVSATWWWWYWKKEKLEEWPIASIS